MNKSLRNSSSQDGAVLNLIWEKYEKKSKRYYETKSVFGFKVIGEGVVEKLINLLFKLGSLFQLPFQLYFKK